MINHPETQALRATRYRRARHTCIAAIVPQSLDTGLQALASQ